MDKNSSGESGLHFECGSRRGFLLASRRNFADCPPCPPLPSGDPGHCSLAVIAHVARWRS
eukprot:1597226-Pleurochrysis_carterae.AAC.8